jgi:phosphoribosylamine--glycine ligase
VTRILLVGGGGREHAIAWRLRSDDPTIDIIAAPGNPGIADLARCIAVSATDIDALVTLAAHEQVDAVIVGPEAPLAAGLVDRLREARIPAFGPTAAAAQLETSKRFAKELMATAGVPTGRATSHTDAASAIAAAHALGAPVVIKASGLAAGKGVVIAESLADAERTIHDMMDSRTLGDAGAEVLIEEFMTGEELSLFVITDGLHAMPLVAAQDHKRLLAGDQGPNTGGMGAYAPVALATREVIAQAMRDVVEPTLAAMRARGIPFTGLLYVGLMLTPSGPKVIEFNCRFGDPETQVVLPLLEGSLLDAMLCVARDEPLNSLAPLGWNGRAAVTTVVAAEGYPGKVRSGDAITVPTDTANRIVFHAGTARSADGTLTTAGGRVVAVTAVADTFAAAQHASRAGADAVQFAGRQFRADIGWREAARSAGTP